MGNIYEVVQWLAWVLGGFCQIIKNLPYFCLILQEFV